MYTGIHWVCVWGGVFAIKPKVFGSQGYICTCTHNKLNNIAEYVLENLSYQWEKQHVINDLIIDLSAPKRHKKSYKLICTVMYLII